MAHQISLMNEFILVISPITHTDNIKYLGINIPHNLDFNSLALKKFHKVSGSVYSQSYLGLTPNGVNPKLKTFIHNTYCLSQFTYALETTTLITNSLKTLNISKNSLIGLNKLSHISDVLKSIKLFDIRQLYFFTKVSLLNLKKFYS